MLSRFFPNADCPLPPIGNLYEDPDGERMVKQVLEELDKLESKAGYGSKQRLKYSKLKYDIQHSIDSFENAEDLSRIFALRYACLIGDVTRVEELLADSRVNPSCWNNEALLCSIRQGKNAESVVRLILDDGRVDPTEPENAPLFFAMFQRDGAVLRELLEDKRVSAALIHLSFFDYAFVSGNVNVVRVLLDKYLVDDQRLHIHRLHMAVAFGHVEVVRLLLVDIHARFNKVSLDNVSLMNESLAKACPGSALNLHARSTLSQSLAKCMDSRMVAFTLKPAPLGAYVDIARLLLADSFVDPLQNGTMCLMASCEHGYADIVRVLLSDERVDASANHNEALYLARLHGHAHIVDILLSHDKTTASVCKQCGLRNNAIDTDATVVHLRDRRRRDVSLASWARSSQCYKVRVIRTH